MHLGHLLYLIFFLSGAAALVFEIPHLDAWVKRVRARPGVGRGLAYGVPEDEVDQWSAARKARVAAGGSSMAATKNLDRGPSAGGD